jgi:hypothetical protein
MIPILYEREKNVCIPYTTLCIQTHNKNYKIDSQCKANEKSVSDQTSPNLGFFGGIRWNFLEETLN